VTPINGNSFSHVTIDNFSSYLKSLTNTSTDHLQFSIDESMDSIDRKPSIACYTPWLRKRLE